MGARIVIEEEAASGIGTTAHWGGGAFDKKFGGGARDGGKKPFEATFAGDEFQTPAFSTGNEFVVTFSEAEEIVDGLNPHFRKGLFLDKGGEDGPERFPKTQDF